MVKEYNRGSFISSVVYDKLDSVITSNIKIFDILEEMFGHIDKNNMYPNKKNSYVYNDFLFNNFEICSKTVLDIAILSKYRLYDIRCLIEDYLLFHKGVEIDVEINSSYLFLDTYFKNLEPLIHKYEDEKRMFVEYIKIPKSHTTIVLFMDESIANEIDIHIDFLACLYDTMYNKGICDIHVCDISSLPKNYKTVYKDKYIKDYVDRSN